MQIFNEIILYRGYTLQGKPIDILWQKLDKDGRFNLPSHYESLLFVVLENFVAKEEDKEENFE